MRTTPITVAEIMAWRPCGEWPEARVAAFVGEGLTPQQFLDSTGLEPRELEWVLLRREVLSDAALRGVLLHCAEAIASGLGSEPPAGAEPLSAGLDGLDAGLDAGVPAVGTLDGDTEPAPEPAALPDVAALAAWPDPLGALSVVQPLAPTLTIDALRSYLLEA